MLPLSSSLRKCKCCHPCSTFTLHSVVLQHGDDSVLMKIDSDRRISAADLVGVEEPLPENEDTGEMASQDPEDNGDGEGDDVKDDNEGEDDSDDDMEASDDDYSEADSAEESDEDDDEDEDDEDQDEDEDEDEDVDDEEDDAQSQATFQKEVNNCAYPVVRTG
ncbi:hypothetical protein NL676_030481 [Syzygium grande]|nr:hypothetical protein NL676_030481 [Syzygium grande]